MSEQDTNQDPEPNEDGTVTLTAEQFAELRQATEVPEALTKRLEAIEKRAATRPPNSSEIKDMFTEALGLKSEGIEHKQEGRDAANKADEVLSELAKLKKESRRRDLIEAAREAKAHSPTRVAETLMGGDDDTPADEAVSALRKDEAWMFKTSTDPDMTGASRHKTTDPGLQELFKEIAESRGG